MSSSREEATLSIPSLAIVAVLGFFIYRYFFASRNDSIRGNTSSTNSRTGLRFTPAQVDQISQMFPQINRRDIMWDLHRNRGSVQATTERVLMSGRLEPAPPSFQPPVSFTTTSSVVNTAPAQAMKQGPDLITRYNLQSKVNSKGKEREEEETPAKGWSSSKEQRQQMLQRRRDEMILAARRKMQEKESHHAPLPPEAT